MTPDGHCETLPELCDYIEAHMGAIFIREISSATAAASAIALDQLPAPLAIKHVLQFIRQGHTPHYVRTDAPQVSRFPPPELPAADPGPDVSCSRCKHGKSFHAGSVISGGQVCHVWTNGEPCICAGFDSRPREEG